MKQALILFTRIPSTRKDENPADALFFTKAVCEAAYLFSERYQ